MRKYYETNLQLLMQSVGVIPTDDFAEATTFVVHQATHPSLQMVESIKTNRRYLIYVVSQDNMTQEVIQIAKTANCVVATTKSVFSNIARFNMNTTLIDNAVHIKNNDIEKIPDPIGILTVGYLNLGEPIPKEFIGLLNSIPASYSNVCIEIICPNPEALSIPSTGIQETIPQWDIGIVLNSTDYDIVGIFNNIGTIGIYPQTYQSQTDYIWKDPEDIKLGIDTLLSDIELREKITEKKYTLMANQTNSILERWENLFKNIPI